MIKISDLNKIENNNVRNLFSDILELYFNKKYSYCIVGLYSLVIYDIVDKLNTMKDLYSDNNATRIISEYKHKINQQDKFSTIENYILEEVYKLPTFTIHFKQDINYLKQLRNYCAHPVIYDNKLYIPEVYKVEMLIQNIYEKLLIKNAPILSNIIEICKQEIDSLENNIDKFNYKSNSEKYFQKYETKFFENMNNKGLKELGNFLFKMLFILNNSVSNQKCYSITIMFENLLKYLQKTGKTEIISNFQYSNIYDNFTDDRVEIILHLSFKKTLIFQKIKEKNPIFYDQLKNKIKENHEFLKIYNHLFFSMGELIDYLKDIINNNSISIIDAYRIFESNYTYLADEDEFNNICSDFIVFSFEKIPNHTGFDIADFITEKFIFLLNNNIKFTNIQFDKIYKINNSNNQVYNRNKFENDRQTIIDLMKKNYPSYYSDDFNNFSKMLTSPPPPA